MSAIRRHQLNDEMKFDIAPEQAIAVISDIHGRYDLLRQILGDVPEDFKIICVGDLIDRGEDSGSVLRYVYENDNITSLLGNHEEMLLQFIDKPETYGDLWLKSGGLQTLDSLGVQLPAGLYARNSFWEIRETLVDQLGVSLISWLKDLPSFLISGNIVVVHAGANPRVPIEAQHSKHLRWGHAEFFSRERDDGLVVVHGHTIVDEPIFKCGRVSIDTGAYATNRLTVALIQKGDITFKTT